MEGSVYCVNVGLCNCPVPRMLGPGRFPADLASWPAAMHPWIGVWMRLQQTTTWMSLETVGVSRAEA